MRWIDMHCDTLSELCGREGENLYHNSLCVDIGRLEQAGAELQFFACFVDAAAYGGTEVEKTWDRAWEKVLELLRRAKEQEGEAFRFLRDPGEMLTQKRHVRGILTVEEGGVLAGKTGRLERLYREGVRLLTLTWNYENCIGSPNSRDPEVMSRGLKPFGFEVVERMNDRGMVVDVSHLSDGGFRDCIRHSRYPVAASHSNARALCPHPRNLSDGMLRALGENGGVAGVNFYGAFLTRQGVTGDPHAAGGKAEEDRKTPAGPEDIARHVRYMMDRAGEDAVALGSDFDGFDLRSLPRGIRGVQDMELLWDALKREGLSERQIEKAAYRNVRRLLQNQKGTERRIEHSTKHSTKHSAERSAEQSAEQSAERNGTGCGGRGDP